MHYTPARCPGGVSGVLALWEASRTERGVLMREGTLTHGGVPMHREFAAPTGSVTSCAAGVLVLRGDMVLMVKQRRNSGVRWEIPSGGQEPGESLELTAARETKEEAGLSVSIDRLICTYTCFRPTQASIVMGAVFLATEDDVDGVPVPQLDDGIEEAAFLNPFALATDDVGFLTSHMIQTWWPHRESIDFIPFNVQLWRLSSGYALTPQS